VGGNALNRKFCAACIPKVKLKDELEYVCEQCQAGTLKTEEKIHQVVSIYSSNFDNIIPFKKENFQAAPNKAIPQ
jgi:hypothetical protein